MATDDSSMSATLDRDSGSLVDRLERGIMSRRTFLSGLGIGTVGGAGVALGLDRPEAGFQSLATLAGGATVPSGTSYWLPAVDATGAGLIVAVAFAFDDGDGELFVDVGNVDLRHDVQLALREARRTAAGLTGSSLDAYATHVRFDTTRDDRLTLSGKSWEAGMTIALVAALRRQSLASDTLVTGIVDDEGNLLPVGGIEAKARAARDFGATELIVPEAENSVRVRGIRTTGVQSVSDVIETVL